MAKKPVAYKLSVLQTRKVGMMIFRPGRRYEVKAKIYDEHLADIADSVEPIYE